MKYTYEFKRQVVEDYLTGGGGVLFLAKKYGIPGKSLVHQWIKAYREFGEDGLKASWTKEVRCGVQGKSGEAVSCGARFVRGGRRTAAYQDACDAEPLGAGV